MNSLKVRLLVAATSVLAAFIVATGLALEQAFRRAAEQAMRDKLQGLVYATLSATEIDADGSLRVTLTELRDERLVLPDSGLYALVLGVRGRPLWRSPSLFNPLPAIEPLGVGEWRFGRIAPEHQQPLFLLAFGVRWTFAEGAHRRLTFVALEDTRAFARQLADFRATLFSWLLGAAVFLLLAQLLVLRWGLAPLRRLAREVRLIEAGEQPQLEGQHHDELRPLANALNALLRSERSRQTRYRNALADLAHSLKTPLAAMRGLTDRALSDDDIMPRLSEQLARMNQIVEYQLKRAATAGGHTLARPLALKPLADKIARAVAKVYHDKAIEYLLDVPPSLRVRADEGDLLELLGNLLDNAAKCCHKRVQLEVTLEGGRLHMLINDDGPGFPAWQREALLTRGVRRDVRSEGQGIGLSVVAEIAKAYGGAVELDDSPLGGARVTVWLPQ
jgi:two-component system, OmpR family, sensor histidine kinase PhoQ